MSSDAIAAAFRYACFAELRALKPGNVHDHAPGHGMSVSQFERSAEAAAPFIAEAGASVGRRIVQAIEASFAAADCNTNLGIVLLAAPLAAAAEARSGDLRSALRTVLARLTVEDAQLAFRAIVHANPAGLGEATAHDVRQTASATLLEAMHAAADRDRIARQYATAFADVFELGLPAVQAATAAFGENPRATTALYLALLSAFPDSHITRKYGLEAASAVMEQVQDLARSVSRGIWPERELMALDARLKDSSLNPGTTADLTVATLFARRLAR